MQARPIRNLRELGRLIFAGAAPSRRHVKGDTSGKPPAVTAQWAVAGSAFAAIECGCGGMKVVYGHVAITGQVSVGMSQRCPIGGHALVGKDASCIG